MRYRDPSNTVSTPREACLKGGKLSDHIGQLLSLLDVEDDDVTPVAEKRGMSRLVHQLEEEYPYDGSYSVVQYHLKD